jgi:RimJ/RimL family protein N-acetyltransferase
MAEPTVELRRFEETDRETLAPWFPSARSEGAFIDERWLDWMREDQGEPDAPLFLVGHQDGAPVSAVSFHPKGDDRAIVTIIVAPHARRRGIATATLGALRETFPGVDEITAYVDPENAPSLKLLRSLGLIHAGTVKDRELFVWRRDGSPLPDGWTPPA